MGIINPIFSWLLLLTLPIIALYLLRPRSQKKVAPSTFLWKKTIESIDTDRLDKRLMKNWLFYLQLAIIILGALLLMQPYLWRTEIESKEMVILIDSSASMSTHSEEISRLEDAKATAKDLINSLKGKPTITLYTLNTEMMQLYKGDSKQSAIKEIERIEQSQKALESVDLQRLIDGFATLEEGPDVFVLSDHQILDDASIQYSLSTQGRNAVLLNQVVARQGESGDHLQIVLENLLENKLEEDIAIYGEDTLLSIEKISLDGNEKKSLQFTSENHYKNYTVSWLGEDEYVLDNHFYVAVESVSVKKILLRGHNNKFLEQSLMILPNVEVYRSEDLFIDTGYDLYVYNGLLPETLPKSGSLLLIHPDKSSPYLSLGSVEENGHLYFDTSDPMWRHVNLNFGIRKVRTLDTVIGKSILSIDDSPVIVKGKIENNPTVIISFDLMESDFPIRTGFPVFMHNTVSYLLGNLSHEIRVGTVAEVLSVYGEASANKRQLVDLEGNERKIDDAYELSLLSDIAGLFLLQEYDDQSLLKEGWIAFNVTRDESFVSEAFVDGEATIMNQTSLGYQSLKWYIAGLLVLLLFIEWWVYYRGY